LVGIGVGSGVGEGSTEGAGSRVGVGSGVGSDSIILHFDEFPPELEQESLANACAGKYAVIANQIITTNNRGVFIRY
jgi:hypothetical protein